MIVSRTSITQKNGEIILKQYRVCSKLHFTNNLIFIIKITHYKNLLSQADGISKIYAWL